ncbi:hypothetical protein PINS_up009574 [Pythium insidiosum]|nr:hypothetical protein PINS_up009574 [Pythium insidiosum]
MAMTPPPSRSLSTALQPQVIQDLVTFCVPERMAHVPGIVPRRALQLGMYMVVAWFLNDRQAMEPEVHRAGDDADVSDDEDENVDSVEYVYPQEEVDMFDRDDAEEEFNVNRWLLRFPLDRMITPPQPALAADWLIDECVASDSFDMVGYRCQQSRVREQPIPRTMLVVTALNDAQVAFEQVAALLSSTQPNDEPEAREITALRDAQNDASEQTPVTRLFSTELATRVVTRVGPAMVFVLHAMSPEIFEGTSDVLTAAAAHGREALVRHVCNIKGTQLSALATERASVNGNLHVVRFLHELTRRLPNKLKVDPRDVDAASAHDVVLRGATRALPQVLIEGNDLMAAYLVGIGAMVSTSDLALAAERGCVSALEIMLRRDSEATLDVSVAMQAAKASGQHMSFQRLRDASRRRQPAASDGAVEDDEAVGDTISTPSYEQEAATSLSDALAPAILHNRSSSHSCSRYSQVAS